MPHKEIAQLARDKIFQTHGYINPVWNSWALAFVTNKSCSLDEARAAKSAVLFGGNPASSGGRTAWEAARLAEMAAEIKDLLK